MDLNSALTLTVSGVLVAGFYASMSYGLSVIYGVMKIINLAHAGFLMLGAYLALALLQVFGIDPLIGLVIILPVFFLLGMGLERTLVRRVKSGSQNAGLLLLFGVWLVLQNIAYSIWSGDTQTITRPYTFAKLSLGGITVPTAQLIVCGVSVVSLIALHLLLTRTFMGRAIRAASQNSEASYLVGVNVERVGMVAFGIGTAFAGLAGGLVSIVLSFTPDFGRVYMLKGLCIIVLGGMDNLMGVAVGSLLLAMAEAWSGLMLPAGLQDILSYVLLVVVLLVLPGGVMKLAEGRRVG